MWQRLRRFRKRVSEEELREEFDSHLAHQIDEHVERGVSPYEARYRAVRQFGNLTRHIERFREASPWFWLETFAQDIRHGWRSFMRTKVLFAASILSVGVGIGASTALFSVLDATVLHPFTYRDSDRLALLTKRTAAPTRVPVLVRARDVGEYAALDGALEGAASGRRRRVGIRVGGVLVPRPARYARGSRDRLASGVERRTL